MELTNLSLGERVHQALVDAARLKSEALRLEKLCKRVKAQCMILSDEKSAGMKEAEALTHLKYIEAEDAWIRAQTEANLATAEADGLQVRWEEWRTREATTRAEMNLR